MPRLVEPQAQLYSEAVHVPLQRCSVEAMPRLVEPQTQLYSEAVHVPLQRCSVEAMPRLVASHIPPAHPFDFDRFEGVQRYSEVNNI